MIVRATFDGQPLLNETEVSWPERTGTSPVLGHFDITPAQLAYFLPLAVSQIPLDLEIDYGSGTQSVRGLYVIREEPGPNPHIKRILVADRRRFWRVRWILRRYNMRRRTGTARRGQWNAVLQTAVVPEIQHARFSLKGGIVWKADEVLLDVLTALGEVGAAVHVSDLSRLPVENLALDDRGDLALQRALELLPGARVTLTPAGVVRVFSALTGAEEGVVGTGEIGQGGAAGPELQGRGHVELVTDHADRPRSVFVGFTIEAEIRIDCLAGDETAGTTGVPADPDNPPLEAVNVIQVPDFALTVAGQAVAQGTWMPFTDYLAAISGGRSLINRLDDRLMRILSVPGMGLAADLDLLAKGDASGEAADWGARVAALQHYYRTYYRVERHLMDRFLSLQPYLVATIDTTSGQRAPAVAFSDYTFVWSKKANVYQGGGLGETPAYCLIVDGYPGPDGDFTAATAKPSPVKVHVVDSDQGIIQLEYLLNPYGFVEAILPGKLVDVPMRSFGMDDPEPVAFDVMSRNGGIPQLSTEQRVAIVLTAVPAAPNDNRQLYWIEVKPADVRDLLPDGAARGLDSAHGPSIHVRIPASVETARVAWQQSRAANIRRIFGLGGLFLDDRSQLAGLVMNDEEQNVLGASAASLRALARAAAAAEWAHYPVRVMGARETPLNVALPLVGQIDEIRHGVASNGAAISSIGLAPETFPLDIWSFLDSGTRQVVSRMIVGPYRMGG